MTGRRASYVLPIRWSADRPEVDDLTRYLTWLSGICDVVIVDGSPAPLFDAHHREWGSLGVHCRPDDDLRCLNGKVSGVRTGMRRVSTERVVIADDDVRYDETSLARVIDELENADLVVPQNVFRPLPWHARWDTARSLVNRAFGSDFPGTLGIRRRAFQWAGGYDGDVLFENLELMRTLRAAGARVRTTPSVFVTRRPPSAETFWSQRIRQAYDSLAQPGRLVAELALLPTGVRLARRSPTVAGAALFASCLVAETGRRRDGGRRAFPATSALWAPAWLLERAVCSWLALGLRSVRGGVRYAGTRIVVAAHSRRELGRRYRDRGGTAARPRGRGPEPGGDMPTVAERLDGRLPAPAQRDGRPPGVDDFAVTGLDLEVAADQQRPVIVSSDHRFVASHNSLVPAGGNLTITACVRCV